MTTDNLASGNSNLFIYKDSLQRISRISNEFRSDFYDFLTSYEFGGVNNQIILSDNMVIANVVHAVREALKHYPDFDAGVVWDRSAVLISLPQAQGDRDKPHAESPLITMRVNGSVLRSFYAQESTLTSELQELSQFIVQILGTLRDRRENE